MSQTLWRRCTSYAVSAVMLCNANVFTVAALMSTPAYAQSQESEPEQDALFRQLQEEFDTANPYNNYGQGRELEFDEAGPSRDLTDTLQRMINESSSQPSQIDPDLITNPGLDQDSSLDAYTNDALSIGKSVGMPSMSPQGNIRVEYARESTVEVYRDEAGALRVRPKANAASIERNTNGVAQNEAFSSEIDHDQTSADGLTTYGDEPALYDVGRQTHSKLKAQTTRTGEANAYQAVTGSARQVINTEVPDAILQPGYTAFERDTQNNSAFLNGCTSTTTVEDGSLYRPELYTERCNEYQTDNVFFCEIERDYRVPMTLDEEGLTSCGPGCFEMEIGWEDEPRKFTAPSECQAYPETRTFTMTLQPGMDIENVSIQGFIDDHTKFSVNGTPIYSRVNFQDGVDLPLPNTGAGATSCETDTWQPISRNVTAGVRQVFESQKAVQPDGTEKLAINLLMNNVISVRGGYYAKIRFQFSDEKNFTPEVKQYPEGCHDAVAPAIKSYGGLDAMYGAGLTDADIPASQCRFDAYEVIEEGTRGLPPSALDTLPPLFSGDDGYVTWKANLEGYTCDPLQGDEICVVGQDNVERCFTWDDMREMEQPNSCKAYVEDNSCTEIERECIEGWTHPAEVNGESVDYCFNQQVTFECDRGNDVGYEYTSTRNTCDSMIPCAGGDCGLTNNESNGRFLEAMSMSHVMEHIKSDSVCTDPANPETCEVFQGEYEYCSWETTGLGTDCCESPGGVNFVQYLQFSLALMRYDAKVLDGFYTDAIGDAAKGAWDTIADPIVEGAGEVWDELYEPFTSAVENAIGNVAGMISGTPGVEPVKYAFGEGMMGAAKTQAAQFIYDAMPEELAELVFTANLDGEVTGLTNTGQNIVTTVNWLMTAYMTYQLVKLALTLLTACDENEQDVGLKLQMRQCFEVGDDYCETSVLGVCMVKRQNHCCYGSMLSRIVMEQAAPMLGKDMSQCAGLTMEELKLLDFSQIDLSEWTATLLENDLMPKNSEEALTGSGRQDNKGARQTVTERTLLRTEGIAESLDARTEALKSPNLDCSQTPRPPVCQFRL